MRKELILQGLDCADCASKIERRVSKIDGVVSATISLTTSKMRVELSGENAHGEHKNVMDAHGEHENVMDTHGEHKSVMDAHEGEEESLGIETIENTDLDSLVKMIEKIVHAYEPDVQVFEAKAGMKHRIDDEESRSKILWLSIGALIFFAGIFFEYVSTFAASDYIALGFFAFSYLLLGGKVLLRMFRNIAKGRVFDENFLMGFATLGAIAIGKPAEAVTVMLFYQIGEFFQEMAVSKSKKRIGDLMDIRPDYANVLKDGEYVRVSPETLEVGDDFVVKPGERIPLDGVVIEGESTLNTMALTGESLPRKVKISDKVLSGCINQNGVLTVKATQTFGESTVSKILDLVENAAHKKAPTETFIAKFARYYTPVVVILAVLLAIIPPLFFGGEWVDWINRALIFLVISCPCALVISIPLGFFGGIGGASKRGILVKGGNYLEALANLDIVVFDKTGTLTEGVFKVTEIQASNGFDEATLLEAAAQAESLSNHPIALSIVKAYGGEIDKEALKDYEEIPGHGVQVEIYEQVAEKAEVESEEVESKEAESKEVERVSKRATLEKDKKIRMSARRILAGNEKLMKKMGISFSPSKSTGTKVYVAINDRYAGCIVIADEIKADSREAIARLRKLGVKKTVMLTGDTWQIAESVAREIGLDEVHASLLPQDKVEKVEAFGKEKRQKKALAFVGDGINDAPVLAMADVGVAMGGLGSDAAIEAADVVLMTDEPMKLGEAVKIARFTKRIVWQNIVLSLGVKFLFLFLATLGVSSLWEAIFADVGVSLIAVVNSMRVMKN